MSILTNLVLNLLLDMHCLLEHVVIYGHTVPEVTFCFVVRWSDLIPFPLRVLVLDSQQVTIAQSE